MLNSGKYLIATPGQSSRPMTLSEVNLGLASGEVLPDDQFWIKGMPRWEKLKDLPGVIIPATPKVRICGVGRATTSPFPQAVDTIQHHRAADSSAPLSFWAQPDLRPRVKVWSPGAYLGLSVFFTPLIGSAMMVQNHNRTDETIWRGIAWFWIIVWSLFVVAAASLNLAAVECGAPLYWVIGYSGLVVGWFFTCALPHSRFLGARKFEAAWRLGLGKPLGFGLGGWIVVATAYLLTR